MNVALSWLLVIKVGVSVPVLNVFIKSQWADQEKFPDLPNKLFCLNSPNYSTSLLAYNFKTISHSRGVSCFVKALVWM